MSDVQELVDAVEKLTARVDDLEDDLLDEHRRRIRAEKRVEELQQKLDELRQEDAKRVKELQQKLDRLRQEDE